MSRTVALVLAAGLLAVACGGGEPGRRADRPETRPSFSVQMLDGADFDLNEHQQRTGRPVVVNLWASWCLPCRNEMPAIDRAARARPDVTFVGIAVQDRPDDAEQFAREIGVAYPIAIDDTGAIEDLFRIPGLPMTLFITSDGVLVGTSFGELTDLDLEEKLEEHFGG